MRVLRTDVVFKLRIPRVADAVRQMVRSLVGTMSRPALERIYELSAGNPMYAIELARSTDVTADPLSGRAPAALWVLLALLVFPPA